MNQRTGRLSGPMHIVVSGPSGAGKTTVVERLLESGPELRLSVSVTTRPPRAHERHGREYEFVDHDEFRRRREAGAFVEWAEVYGELYGTPRAGLDALAARGFDVLFDVDHQGGLAIMRAYPAAISVFIVPPSLEVLEARLRRRGSDGEEQIRRRLEVAELEMAHAVQYQFLVINDDVERAYEQVAAIVTSERRRISRMDARALERLIHPAAAR